jgi:hypothetical protein
VKCPCFAKAREMIPGFCLRVVSLFLPSELLPMTDGPYLRADSIGELPALTLFLEHSFLPCTPHMTS